MPPFGSVANPKTFLSSCTGDRLDNSNPSTIPSLAVNVVVTGRTWQRRQGDYYVRVEIEFVGDGEPSVFAGGWMLRD